MKEYWVNVYKGDYIMGIYYSRNAAILYAEQLGGGVAYRIHVKIKEPKLIIGREILARQKAYKMLPAGRSWMD